VKFYCHLHRLMALYAGLTVINSQARIMHDGSRLLARPGSLSHPGGYHPWLRQKLPAAAKTPASHCKPWILPFCSTRLAAAAIFSIPPGHKPTQANLSRMPALSARPHIR
jgi:hypothetical protein